MNDHIMVFPLVNSCAGVDVESCTHAVMSHNGCETCHRPSRAGVSLDASLSSLLVDSSSRSSFIVSCEFDRVTKIIIIFPPPMIHVVRPRRESL